MIWNSSDEVLKGNILDFLEVLKCNVEEVLKEVPGILRTMLWRFEKRFLRLLRLMCKVSITGFRCSKRGSKGFEGNVPEVLKCNVPEVLKGDVLEVLKGNVSDVLNANVPKVNYFFFKHLCHSS